MDIFVHNRNPFTHVDRYNGMDYVFPAGEKVAVPAEAAAHMLGFARADKTDNLLRLGWNHLPHEEGVSRLAKFVFSEARLVEADVPTLADITTSAPNEPKPQNTLSLPGRKRTDMSAPA